MLVFDDIVVDIVSLVFCNYNVLIILIWFRDKYIYNWWYMINIVILVSVFVKYLGYKEKIIKELVMGVLLYDIG